MGRKRKNGEGCWGKKKIGKYIYFFYRNANGEYVYGRTEKEVKQKLSANNEKQHSIKVDSTLTLGEYLELWLYKKRYKDVGLTLENSSFDCYEASLTKRLYDYKISNKQVSELDKDDFTSYLKALAKKYSRGSIKKTWQVINMALQDEDFDLYDYVPNIKWKTIKIPSEGLVAVKKKEHNFTSNEDMTTLYNEALRKTSNDKYYYGNAARLLAFIMYSGLRVGEAIGLKWKDVDLVNGLITITQTYSDVRARDKNGNKIGYEHVEKAPKSEASAATIPCRKQGIEILQLMASENPNRRKQDLVFMTFNHTAFTKRHVHHTLKRMLVSTGLADKDYTVHDLRHGYGSILYQEGVDIMTISKLLRHSDIQTTANIYVKTIPDTLKNVLDRIDKED